MTKKSGAVLKEFASQFVFYDSHIYIAFGISVGNDQIVPGDDTGGLVDFHLSLMSKHVLSVMGHTAVFHIKDFCISHANGRKVQGEGILTDA